MNETDLEVGFGVARHSVYKYKLCLELYMFSIAMTVWTFLTSRFQRFQGFMAVERSSQCWNLIRHSPYISIQLFMIDFVFGLLVSIFLSKDIFLAMIRENPSSISNNFLRPPYFSNHVGDFRDETADDRYRLESYRPWDSKIFGRSRLDQVGTLSKRLVIWPFLPLNN